MLALVIAATATLGIALLLAVALGFFRRRANVDTGPAKPGYLDNLRFDLAEAGINLPARKFLFYNALTAAIVSLLLLLVFGYDLLALICFPLTFWGYRWFVVGRAARKRNLLIAQQSARAARRMAAALAANIPTETALAMVARQASPQTASVVLDEEDPIVARALWDARVQITEKRVNEEAALRAAAQALGNRHFSSLIETYLTNAPHGASKLQEGCLALAVEIEWALKLRDEMITWLSQPINNYKMVGLITVGLALYMQLMVPGMSDFMRSWPGQIATVLLVGWWSIGYRLQRRKLNDRV